MEQKGVIRGGWRRKARQIDLRRFFLDSDIEYLLAFAGL
jgi:hypothetical protein